MRHLIALLSIFTFLTSSTLHAQPPSYVPTNGLVGWWPFNGNANDESGNGINGVNNGANLTDDRYGNNNSAYDFQGNNWIECAFNPLLNVGNESFSISCWATKSGANQFQHLVTRNEINSSTSAVGSYILRYEGSGITFILSGDLNNNNGVLFTTTTPNLNLWNQIVGVYNSQNSTMSIFINGDLIISAPVNPNAQSYNNNGSLFFGVEHPTVPLQSGPQFLTGKLDDIGIWNRALTPAEIQSLYNAQPLIPCLSPAPVSFSGLSTSYTTNDGPVALAGIPDGGIFIGPGVSGNTFSPSAAGEGTHGIIYTFVDDNDCVNSFSLCTSVSLGMGLEPGTDVFGGLKVFPNPNRGQFTVELDLNGLVGMQVFDSKGALVHTEVFSASGRTQRNLDLSTFSKGSYTLIVENNGQKISQKVVVE
jgi:hypothetical protein